MLLGVATYYAVCCSMCYSVLHLFPSPRHDFACGRLALALLQCVAMCCNVLQFVAPFFNCAMRSRVQRTCDFCVAVCCSVLQCVAVYAMYVAYNVCCRVLQHALQSVAPFFKCAMRPRMRRTCSSHVAVCCSVQQCVAVCCGRLAFPVLQSFAVCCSTLQRMLQSVAACATFCCTFLQVHNAISHAVDLLFYCRRVLQCVAVYCNVCCSVLQCIAMYVAACATMCCTFFQVRDAISHAVDLLFQASRPDCVYGVTSLFIINSSYQRSHELSHELNHRISN